ncbi:MAG: alkaline phosphatase family protein, partial [Elusimicrobiota bacterium]
MEEVEDASLHSFRSLKPAALFAALCALASGAGAAQPPRAGNPPPARLLVVLSVDQMRADYLDRFPPSGPGGFSRLLREGAYFSQARNTDVPTETSPGHATLLTGRPPSAHCVVAYDWWDPGIRRMVYSVEDPVFGRSPRNLLSPTLGDALKSGDPASLVVSISGKDRSGILLGGHRPDAAIWYEPKIEGFATSPYYGPLPSWAARFTARRPLGFTLTPAFDRLILDAALEAVRSLSLGADEHADLLAVGISGVDVVGHRHGPGHPSMDAQLEGLDEGLGRFLSELDRLVGRGRYALVLASADGVLPVPESAQGRGRRGPPRALR